MLLWRELSTDHDYTKPPDWIGHVLWEWFFQAPVILFSPSSSSSHSFISFHTHVWGFRSRYSASTFKTHKITLKWIAKLFPIVQSRNYISERKQILAKKSDWGTEKGKSFALTFFNSQAATIEACLWWKHFHLISIQNIFYVHWMFKMRLAFWPKQNDNIEENNFPSEERDEMGERRWGALKDTQWNEAQLTPQNAHHHHDHRKGKSWRNLIWIIIRISSILDFEWIGIHSSTKDSRHIHRRPTIAFCYRLKKEESERERERRISCHRNIVFTKCYVSTLTPDDDEQRQQRWRWRWRRFQGSKKENGENLFSFMWSATHIRKRNGKIKAINIHNVP